MSKNCPDCGASLSDSATYCLLCGAQFGDRKNEADENRQAKEPAREKSPAKKKKKIKTADIVVTAITVAVVIGAIFLIVRLLNPRDKGKAGENTEAAETLPEAVNVALADAIRLYYEGIADGSRAKVQQASSQHLWTQFLSIPTGVDSVLEAQKATFEQRFGENAVITVTVADSEAFTGDAMKSRLKNVYNCDADKYGITELREADYTLYVNDAIFFSAKGSVALENGTWVLLRDHA